MKNKVKVAITLELETKLTGIEIQVLETLLTDELSALLTADSIKITQTVKGD